MKRPPSTKAELLALIELGPTAVQLIYATSMYRVSVPADEDPNGGVWISLSSDGRYVVEDYAKVFAYVAGREIQLTQREANFVRGLVATTMRLRAKPIVRDVVKTTRRRRTVKPRQNRNAESRGGKTRSSPG